MHNTKHIKGAIKMTNNKQDYGLKLTGVVRVFRKDKQINSNGNSFTISDVWFNTSQKDEQGNYDNVSTNLFFKRGMEPPINNSIIEIIEAFPMINGKGQYKKTVYYVKGWHYATGYEQPQQQQQQHQGGQAPPQNQQQYNQQQYQQNYQQPNNQQNWQQPQGGNNYGQNQPPQYNNQ